MEKEILERANKGETSQICSAIGAGLGLVDQTGVTVTSGQSSYVGRGGSLLSFRRRGNSQKNTNYVTDIRSPSSPSSWSPYSCFRPVCASMDRRCLANKIGAPIRQWILKVKM